MTTAPTLDGVFVATVVVVVVGVKRAVVALEKQEPTPVVVAVEIVLGVAEVATSKMFASTSHSASLSLGRQMAPRPVWPQIASASRFRFTMSAWSSPPPLIVFGT